MRSLPAAHELNDFEARAGLEDGLGPERLFHDAAVHFDGYAGRVQAQMLQQAEDSLAHGGGLRLTVYQDLDRHAWLTLFFCNNYSQSLGHISVESNAELTH
ncbi:hypothetical protein SBA4_1870008 [Candidatus Sulfopaludibacter sp. SbA4]|nr:hypothetical protein SBA4_1870008 [Candidatus Sulfopaludibacter sp. SbA4]